MSAIVRMREEEREDGTAVAILEGEVDASSVGLVAAKLRRLMENRRMRLIIDMGGVVYLDSAGINLLYAVGDELRARQQQLHLVVAPTSPIHRMLRIVGADRAFPTYATLEEALEGS